MNVNTVNKNLVYILIACFTIAGSLFSTYKRIDEIKKDFENDIVYSTNTESTIMSYKMKNHIDSIEKISIDERVRSLDWKVQQKFLVQSSTKYNYDSMGFMTKDGILKSTDGSTNNIKNTPTYESLMLGNNVIDGPIKNPTNNSISFTIAVPTFDSNNKIIGATFSNIPFNQIQEDINHSHLNNKGISFILNTNGDLISSTNEFKKDNFQEIYNINSIFKNNKDFISLINNAKDNNHQLKKILIRGSKKFFYSKKIEGTDWIFFMAYPNSILTKDILSIISGYTIFAASSIFLLIAAFNILMRKFDNSLNHASKILDEERNRSRTDFLTGLSNKGFFEEFLTEVIKKAEVSGESVSIMMIDVDNFKKYNDNYGHLKGDEVLKSVAFALKNSILPPKDFVARFGGEEFVVVLVGYTEEALYHRTSQIVKAVKNLNIPHEYSDADNVVTISSGVVTATLNRYSYKETIPKLLEKADQALYYSKQQGKNRCSNYKDIPK